MKGKLNGAEDHRSAPHPCPHSPAGNPDVSRMGCVDDAGPWPAVLSEDGIHGALTEDIEAILPIDASEGSEVGIGTSSVLRHKSGRISEADMAPFVK